MTALKFVASSPRGFGDLLAAELRSVGAGDVRERALGVEFTGSLEVAYRACLESRVGSRVFLVVAQFTAATDASFYEAARAIDWRAHIDPSRTLACDFSGKHPEITHTRFGALRLKDAICDQLRDATGSRPDIATDRPGVRVHAHANGPERHCVHRPFGRRPASPRLSRRGGRSAAARKPGRRNPGARRLAGEIEGRRRVPRPHVRLGHAGHRSGHDRREHGARGAAELLRILRVGGARPSHLGALEARRAGARAETGAASAWRRFGFTRARGRARQRRARGSRRLHHVRQRPACRCEARGRRRGVRRHQPALRRAPRRPRHGARVDEAVGRSAAREFLGMGRGDSRGVAGRRARARHSRRTRAYGVERRPRVPAVAPARVRRNREADAAHGCQRAHRRVARAVAGLADVRQSHRQERETTQELGETRGRELLPAVRRRHARVFLRDRPLRRVRWRSGVAVRAGICGAEDHRARSGATPAQRSAGCVAGRHRDTGGAHPPAATPPDHAWRPV